MNISTISRLSITSSVGYFECSIGSISVSFVMSKEKSLDELRKKTQEDCVHQSLVAGGKAAAWALATAGTVVFLANQYLPTFRTSLGVSGKTALIVSLSALFSTLSAQEPLSVPAG